MSVNLGGGMDALARRAIDSVGRAGPETGGAGAGGVAAPAESDAQRFQEAMDAGGPGQTGRIDAAGTAPSAVAPTGDAGADSMADRILRGISSVDQKVAGARAEAAEVLGSDNVSQADLLRANFAMIESSTLVSAVSKSTEKLTSAVKTLQQG